MAWTDLVDNVRFKVTRRVVGAAGPPTGMLAGEIAYNMIDGLLYVGYDDGTGTITPRAFAGDDYSGAVGLTAGNGIIIDGSNVISVDTTLIATRAYVDQVASLKADTTFVNEQLALKADITYVDAEVADAVAQANAYTDNELANLEIDASQVTTGVFDVARIPILRSDVVIISSGGLADLTTAQQTEIVTGVIVVTTDGFRWIYSGSGDKTLETSYIKLADVTPEWDSISGKPTFSTVATSGSYNDLLNLPTLGTIASQDADDVAITGGSITGVILDGGIF